MASSRSPPTHPLLARCRRSRRTFRLLSEGRGQLRPSPSTWPRWTQSWSTSPSGSHGSPRAGSRRCQAWVQGRRSATRHHTVPPRPGGCCPWSEGWRSRRGPRRRNRDGGSVRCNKDTPTGSADSDGFFVGTADKPLLWMHATRRSFAAFAHRFKRCGRVLPPFRTVSTAVGEHEWFAGLSGAVARFLFARSLLCEIASCPLRLPSAGGNTALVSEKGLCNLPSPRPHTDCDHQPSSWLRPVEGCNSRSVKGSNGEGSSDTLPVERKGDSAVRG
jgi:hypothetical protein